MNQYYCDLFNKLPLEKNNSYSIAVAVLTEFVERFYFSNFPFLETATAQAAIDKRHLAAYQFADKRKIFGQKNVEAIRSYVSVSENEIHIPCHVYFTQRNSGKFRGTKYINIDTITPSTYGELPALIVENEKLQVCPTLGDPFFQKAKSSEDYWITPLHAEFFLEEDPGKKENIRAALKYQSLCL